MDFENDIFKRTTIIPDKLLTYGFTKTADNYTISKYIMDNLFRIDVEFSNGLMKGKIYDLAFNEEYNNFRIENQTGEFVNSIRQEFLNFLQDIAKNCTIPNLFISPQANRIANLILKEYNDIPEFPWVKSEGYGVFKNPTNKKWYALIMNINKSKITTGTEEVEIINLKLSSSKVKELLTHKGFYKAYHMNKDNWLTIILDETISDNEIMSYIRESHHFTEKSDEYLFPANPKYYDIINYLNNSTTITWKQPANIKVGDIIYFYITAPYSAILYKTQVLKTNISYPKNKSKIMQLKVLKRFKKDKYPLTLLKEYGVKAVRGPRSMPQELSTLLANDNQKKS